MKKITEIKRNGIPYKVTAIYDGSATVEVSIRRIRRPNWKIFRTELFSMALGYFFIVDYPTIEAGIDDTVNKILRRIGIIEETSQKLKNYFDN